MPLHFGRLSALFALFSVVACSSAGGGDLNHVDHTPIQLGTPIADANDPSKPNHLHLCGSHATLTATICGPGDYCPKTCPSLSMKGVVVTGVDRYDETGDGKSIGNIYVQDPVQTGDRGTPFSGLTLFAAQIVPSDLPLQSGDGVDIAGAYDPFPGPNTTSIFPVPLPEMNKGSLGLSYEGHDPTPVDVTIADFQDPKVGVAFVGRLVRVKNVTISGDFSLPRHEAPIDGSAGAAGAKLVMAAQFFPLDDAAGFGAAKGKTYSSVVGVLNYFFSFKLCPRSTEDFTP